MATEAKEKKVTVKEIICSRLKTREERDRSIMQHYDKSIKDKLMDIDDAVLKKGENIIDLVLVTDNREKKWLSAFVNGTILFENEEYQNPTAGFEAFKQMYDSEEGFKGAKAISSDECIEKYGIQKTYIAEGVSFYFKV